MLWERTIRHPLPAERFAAEIAGARIRARGPAGEDGPAAPRRRASDDRRAAHDRRAHRDGARAPRTTPTRGSSSRSTTAASCGTATSASSAASASGRGGGLRSVGAGRGPRSRKVAEGRGQYRIGEVFSGHGPEPLARGFTAKRFAERLSRRSAKLKTLLLDQSFVAGVGNIYADEALWRARLHPLRAADTLSASEVRRLHRAVRQVLRQGIENRGSSFSDYVGVDGEPGDNAERLAVYRRTDQPCYRCGRAIRRIVVGQRSTHFCPRCQPEPVASAGS